VKEERPSVTALSVCFMRAREQGVAASARILDDPFARHFLTRTWKVGLSIAGTRLSRLEAAFPDGFPGLSTYVVCRHRFIDDALGKALSEGIEQVVLLGAGYDSRAWRFASALAGKRLFEVDHPATAARKRRVLSRHSDWPAVDRVQVDCDFSTQDFAVRLQETGFRPGVPTFFVWEGVSMYLSREVIRGTLSRIQALGGPGSQLAMDFDFLPDGSGVRETLWRSTPGLLHALGEPVTFFLHPEEAPGFLLTSGFRVVDLADPGELTRRYVRDGRPVSPIMYVLLARLGDR
jgi:methyltransferase (TIGR00027 family)